MKILSVALLLVASLTFVLLGCSDNTAVPVSPTDHSALAPVALNKSFTREFTATSIPGVPDEMGIFKEPDGKLLIRGHRGPVTFTADFTDGPPDLLSGTGEVEINGISDYNTGVGQWHGKLRITPTAPEAGGGTWEFVYHGPATLGPNIEFGYGWTLNLKDEGHGSGGALTGMRCRLYLVVTTDVGLTAWRGDGEGVVISH